MSLTPLPPGPSRDDLPAAFIAKANAFVAALETLVAEINATSAGFEVSKWNNVTVYTAGQLVWSPIDLQTYRSVAGGSGGGDPSGDIDWQITTIGAVLAIGDVTIGRAVSDGRRAGFPLALNNCSLTCSVAANALTIALKGTDGNNPAYYNAVYAPVRNVTPGVGTPAVMMTGAADSLVVSNGSLLGTANNVPFRLWIVRFNDGGTYRLGVINCLTGAAPNYSIYPLGAWPIASATAEGGAGAADSAHVFYANAAIAAKAYAILGYAEWATGLAAAGAWSAAPTRVHLFMPGTPLPGQTVQQVREQTGAVVTGTTVIPLDDTIPQSGEGDEYIDVTITPSSAANLLEIQAGVLGAHSAAGGHLVAFLVRDATADALASSWTGRDASVNVLAGVHLAHQMLAGLETATTINLRAGTSSAGTTTINGTAGARVHGGVAASYLKAKEIMA